MTLLGVLPLLCIGAFAVFAAGGKADFSIAASPSSQTVSQGQAATYTVTVTRVNGFAEAVTLSASGLPERRQRELEALQRDQLERRAAEPQNSATLTIQTDGEHSERHLAARRSPRRAASCHAYGHVSRLVVQPAAQPNFTSRRVAGEPRPWSRATRRPTR